MNLEFLHIHLESTLCSWLKRHPACFGCDTWLNSYLKRFVSPQICFLYLLLQLLPQLLHSVGQLDVEHQPAHGLEAPPCQPRSGVLLQNQGLLLLDHLRHASKSISVRHCGESPNPFFFRCSH